MQLCINPPNVSSDKVQSHLLNREEFIIFIHLAFDTLAAPYSERERMTAVTLTATVSKKRSTAATSTGSVGPSLP